MYTVHIESMDNSWFGTGFMGINIESMNDLKEAMFNVINNAKKMALLILLQQQLC